MASAHVRAKLLQGIYCLKTEFMSVVCGGSHTSRSSWGRKRLSWCNRTCNLQDFSQLIQEAKRLKKPTGWEAKHLQDHENNSTCPNSTFFPRSVYATHLNKTLDSGSLRLNTVRPGQTWTSGICPQSGDLARFFVCGTTLVTGLVMFPLLPPCLSACLLECCRLPLCWAVLFASLKTSPLPPITQWFVYHEWNSRFGVVFPVTRPLTTVFPPFSMFSVFPGFEPITPLHLFATSYTNKWTPPHSVFDFPACACLPHSRLTFCCGL